MHVGAPARGAAGEALATGDRLPARRQRAVEDRPRRRRDGRRAAVQDARPVRSAARRHRDRADRGQRAHVRGRAGHAGAGDPGAAARPRRRDPAGHGADRARRLRRRVRAGRDLPDDRPSTEVGRPHRAARPQPAAPQERAAAAASGAPAARARPAARDARTEVEARAAGRRRALDVRLLHVDGRARGDRLAPAGRAWSCSRSAAPWCSPRSRSRPAGSGSSRPG